MADGMIIIDTKINTDGFEQGLTEEQKEIKKLEVSLDNLIEKQIRFVETGGNIDSRAFKGMEYDIAQTSARLDELKAKQAQTSTSTASMANGIDAFKRALKNFIPNLATASKMLVKFAGTSIASGFKKIGNSIKNMGKRMLQLGKNTNGTHKSMLKMLGTSLLFSMAFKAISTVINGLKEGINNLSQYSSETNDNLSLLKSSLTQLKNSFATAFAPIISVVTPILNSFISTLSNVINSIGMFIAALTGKGTFTKAIEVQEDYAAGLDNTASSANKAEKAMNSYLSPLDEITKFESPTSDKKEGTVSPSQMFKEVTIDTSIADVAETLKNKIKEGDWKGVGKLLANKVNNIFSSIDFASIGSKLSDILKNIFDGITGFLEELDWQMIGGKVADFIGGIDWSGLVNSLVEGIGAALGGLVALLWGIIQPAWNSVVEWWQKNAYEDGQFTISGLLKGIWNGIKNIGKWIKENIFDPFIKGFKKAFGIASPSKVMKEMGTYIIEGLLEGINSLVENVISIFTDIKDKITKKWEELKTNTSQKWKEITNDLSNKWNSISSSANNFGTKIRDNLTSYFTGLKTNITNTISNLLTALNSSWSNMFSNASQWATSIYSNISNIYNNLKTRVSNVFNSLYMSLHNVWSNISNNASQWVSYVYNSITRGFTNVKNAVVNIFNNLTSGIKNAINNVIYVINRMLSGIVSGINSAISALNRLSFSIPSWIPGIGGKKFSLNIGYASAPQIPYLATGAVIPPNAPFMAVLGDQKHGTNIEAPLSTIEEALENVYRRHDNNSGGSMTIHNVMQVNRRVLFDEFIDEAKLRKSMTGGNPFDLAGGVI